MSGTLHHPRPPLIPGNGSGGPTAPKEPAGLYVHVPFCSGKCGYCDFFSVSGTKRAGDWAEAVLQEARILGHGFGPFDTLYLGGGTPSRLAPDMLARLISGLREAVDLSPEAEITLEANPEDVEAGFLSIYRAAGVNRLSLGVQSLDDRVLALLGRRHSAARALTALEDIRGAGFASVSADLIYGIPGQDLDGWMETLSGTVQAGPDHLSCYELTLGTHTPLGRRAASGDLAMPGQDHLAELFLHTSRFLTSQGYTHYEVSNFARPGHASRHNRKYWRRAPYLGLGPGAHSFRPPRRWWNPRSLEAYLEKLRRNQRPAEAEETLTPEQGRLERLWLGFRTRDGVEAEDLGRGDGAERIALDLVRSGLLSREGRRWVPTTRGLLVSDSLPLLFDP